ncbi:hypothetical protein VTN00DRAFT_5711 [Thermoascus crustaceus]|uniref:uncharacterized protein n=1 Tax=Thermoascus crustaceus TaxID=5088 RepID=UPI003743D9D0
MVKVTPAYLAEDQSHMEYSQQLISFTVLAFLAIVLRLTLRLYGKANFSWDDWTILIAFALGYYAVVG